MPQTATPGVEERAGWGGGQEPWGFKRDKEKDSQNSKGKEDTSDISKTFSNKRKHEEEKAVSWGRCTGTSEQR